MDVSDGYSSWHVLGFVPLVKWLRKGPKVIYGYQAARLNRIKSKEFAERFLLVASGGPQDNLRDHKMDWQIKTISRKSSRTGEPFEPGDVAVCLIFNNPAEGEIGRADLHESELEEFELPGELLGLWRRVIRHPDEESVNASETLASAEDFFFSLFESEDDESESEERQMLKHLLSLMLERKRVLRALGPRKVEGEQLYLHVKSKRELSVPIREMSHQLMLQLQDTIGDIVL